MITDANEYATSIVVGIAELADILGISKSALRFYEKEGLIIPERAEESGYRRYSMHSLVELTDIIMYRNIGIPVKDVRRLLDSPVEETEHALDEAEDELFEQIEAAQKTLRLASARRRKIRAFHGAARAGSHLVERPHVESLYACDLQNKEFLFTYMGAPENARFSVYFPAAADPSEGYLNGTVLPVEGGSKEPSWVCERGPGMWMECLLETGYDLPDKNNLDERVAELQTLGHESGCAVAEYLTFDTDEYGVRHDYYLCWIEAL